MITVFALEASRCASPSGVTRTSDGLVQSLQKKKDPLPSRRQACEPSINLGSSHPLCRLGRNNNDDDDMIQTNKQTYKSNYANKEGRRSRSRLTPSDRVSSVLQKQKRARLLARGRWLSLKNADGGIAATLSTD